jgi:hypothetical protein
VVYGMEVDLLDALVLETGYEVEGVKVGVLITS